MVLVGLRACEPHKNAKRPMNPIDIQKRIEAFQKGIREEIVSEIVSLLTSKGGSVKMQEDSYHGFPNIYSEDSHCTILSFQGAYLNRVGKVVLRSHENIRQPQLTELPIHEMLQVWEHLQRGC